MFNFLLNRPPECRAGDGAARQGRLAGREGGDVQEARRPHVLLQSARVRNAEAGKANYMNTINMLLTLLAKNSKLRCLYIIAKLFH